MTQHQMTRGLYKARQNDIVAVCSRVNDIANELPTEQIKADLITTVDKLHEALGKAILKSYRLLTILQ